MRAPKPGAHRRHRNSRYLPRVLIGLGPIGKTGKITRAARLQERLEKSLKCATGTQARTVVKGCQKNKSQMG